VAELDLLDAGGKPISHNGWTIAYVDSEERAGEDGSAENAIDGQTANFWHTEWKNASPDHPHQLILNLGQPQTISGFRYVPRQGENTGRIKDYRLEQLAPHAPTEHYQHNRTGEDNADAHLKRQIMGREVVVAVTQGRLDFGPWEQIFYGEFDGNRRKRVLVKIIGE
jgi:hypothetical protein